MVRVRVRHGLGLRVVGRVRVWGRVVGGRVLVVKG